MIIRICESEKSVVLENVQTETHLWYSRIEYTDTLIKFYRGVSSKPLITIPVNYGVIIYEDEE